MSPRPHQPRHRRGLSRESPQQRARLGARRRAVVFFDALRVKIPGKTLVARNKAIYLAVLGMLPDGTRDILGHLD